MSSSFRPISGEKQAAKAVKTLAIEAAGELRHAKELRLKHGAGIHPEENTHRQLALHRIVKARIINRAMRNFEDETDNIVWERERRG